MRSAGRFAFSSSCLLVAVIYAISLQAINGASLSGALESMNTGNDGVRILKDLDRLKRDIENVSDDVHNLHTMTNQSIQTTTEAVTESTERNGNMEFFSLAFFIFILHRKKAVEKAVFLLLK